MKRFLKLKTFLMIACFQMSCSNKSRIENAFITSDQEYWSFNDNCGSYGIHFKFHENGTYDKYLKHIKDGYSLFNDDGDLLSGPRNWSITNDTFIWDETEYSIKHCEPNRIVLLYNDGQCEVTLLKDRATK